MGPCGAFEAISPSRWSGISRASRAPLDRDPSTAASPERLEPMRRCLAEAGIGVGIERSLDGEPEPYAELFRFG